jgi:hypothetical protein
MAVYSPAEIQEILVRLSQEPQIEVKFGKFEKQGVQVRREEADSQADSQQYSCSVCKKKLISAHLLDLHVSENHDAYFELKKLKQPMVRIHQVCCLSS